ncbi:F0F1 ATP synthase subunit delta [Pectinatus haikarae]|uniref:ATP synthase subunit delta n=1 Tax=Pectinatus haikarae TaxID=349096 RepID=A0ABT9Y5Z0_9FIRM|nr:F0F1 ATP synthase subunit delta [Pectinatus haikarae]MDQ0203053.1 F-type H+-transporting ATPase subunit delta [Pectinatus haikarae]
MLNIQLAKKYAAAMFELSQEKNKLALHDSQLAQLSKLFEDNRELKTFMDNPQIKSQAKKELMSQILTDSFDSEICNFMLLLIDKHRISLLSEIITSFHALSNEAQGIQIAYVKTAFPLTEAQHTTLLKKLETITAKTIQLKINIDSSIIGGVIVKIGDRLIDGSVVGQIKSIKKQLVANC